jgi:vancomycin resistance protein YoaR
MAQYKGRAPITKKDLRLAKRKAKAIRAQKMKEAANSSGNKAVGIGGLDKKKLLIIIGAAVLLVAIIGMVLFIVTQNKPSEEEILAFIQDGVFATTTTVEDVDISGLTIAQAKEKVGPQLETRFFETKINYQVNGESFNKDAYELGLVTDIEDILFDAMLFEKTGTVFERAEKQKVVETEGQHYQVALSATAENVALSAKKFLPAHGVSPIEPTMSFNPDAKTEADYFEFTDEVAGFAVDESAFIQKAVDSINAGNYDLGEIDVNVIEPEKTKAMMNQSVVKISEYTTFFGTADLDEKARVANISKMSELLSGSVIKPGETWSINETTGERTEDEGWQIGHSIRRGVMIDELGGGVCQVSSTLYNAFLLAEVGIVERHNHTIKSIYVNRRSREEFYPMHDAADATIDYPRKDLKIKNILADDIYIVIVPDADREVENLTAMIFGPKPPHDYKVIIRTIENESRTEDLKPTAEPEKKVAMDGLAPDGTFVPIGEPYAYPRASSGSYWETYKYYYPKDTELEYYYPHRKYTVDNAITYSWVGYVDGDRDSGEKHRLKLEDSDEYIDSIYPAQNGVTFYHPNDPASFGLEGSTYDPNAVVEDPGAGDGGGAADGDGDDATE